MNERWRTHILLSLRRFLRLAASTLVRAVIWHGAKLSIVRKAISAFPRSSHDRIVANCVTPIESWI